MGTFLHVIFLVYLDSSDACNDLAFNIGSGTSTVTRSWRIKVTIFKINSICLLQTNFTFRFLNMIATMTIWLQMVVHNISLDKQQTL